MYWKKWQNSVHPKRSGIYIGKHRHVDGIKKHDVMGKEVYMQGIIKVFVYIFIFKKRLV